MTPEALGTFYRTARQRGLAITPTDEHRQQMLAAGIDWTSPPGKKMGITPEMLGGDVANLPPLRVPAVSNPPAAPSQASKVAAQAGKTPTGFFSPSAAMARSLPRSVLERRAGIPQPKMLDYDAPPNQWANQRQPDLTQGRSLQGAFPAVIPNNTPFDPYEAPATLAPKPARETGQNLPGDPNRLTFTPPGTWDAFTKGNIDPRAWPTVDSAGAGMPGVIDKSLNRDGTAYAKDGSGLVIGVNPNNAAPTWDNDADRLKQEEQHRNVMKQPGMTVDRADQIVYGRVRTPLEQLRTSTTLKVGSANGPVLAAPMDQILGQSPLPAAGPTIPTPAQPHAGLAPMSLPQITAINRREASRLNGIMTPGGIESLLGQRSEMRRNGQEPPALESILQGPALDRFQNPYRPPAGLSHGVNFDMLLNDAARNGTADDVVADIEDRARMGDQDALQSLQTSKLYPQYLGTAGRADGQGRYGQFLKMWDKAKDARSQQLAIDQFEPPADMDPKARNDLMSVLRSSVPPKMKFDAIKKVWDRHASGYLTPQEKIDAEQARQLKVQESATAAKVAADKLKADADRRELAYKTNRDYHTNILKVIPQQMEAAQKQVDAAKLALKVAMAERKDVPAADWQARNSAEQAALDLAIKALADLHKQAAKSWAEVLKPPPAADEAATPAPAQQAETPAPAAPAIVPPVPPVDQREVGKVYAAPDGRKAIWRGNGWEAVQ